MNRQEAREFIMTVAYRMELLNDFQIDSRDDYFIEIEERFKKGFGTQKDYSEEIYSILCNKKEKIDRLISKYSYKWHISRIPTVDLAILRIAIAEMAFFEDIPMGVSINEAVELAKKFSEASSGSYINGILGSIQQEDLDEIREGGSPEEQREETP